MLKKSSHAILSPKQLAILAALLALAIFTVGYTNRVIDNRELQKEVAQWEEEVSQAQQRLKSNQELLRQVQTDQFVIKKARTDLGWAFPGEVVVRTGDDDQLAPVEVTEQGAAEAAPSWTLWLRRFFGQWSGLD